MTMLKFFDRHLNPIGLPIQNPNIRQARRRPNAADYGSFALPQEEEHLDQLSLAAYVTLWDGWHQVLSGYIESRDLSGELYIFTVQGHAHKLKDNKTPNRWVSWNGMDLADVVRDHQYCFKMKRWNTKADWESAQRYQVDIEIEPGAVVLEYEPHPNDPDNTRPKANGYIIVKIDLGPKALDRGRIARWTETVGAETRITIQSRSAATESDLTNQPWGAEMSAVHVDEIQENETTGVPVAGNGRWVEIKVNLYTTDQDTPHKSNDGEITGYGFTPYLDGLEIIWREPIFLEAGNIPDTTGVIVQGFEFQRMDFLQTLCDLCKEYGWEFAVRHDEKKGKVFLDLGRHTDDGWQPKLGTDRTRSSDNPVIFEHGRNAAISVLRESTANMANVLDCWGAGEGTSQLYVQLTDDESVEDYGEIPGEYVNTDADTMAKLIESGQAELAQRSRPEVVFEVQVPVDSLDELKGLECGDRVTVVHPKKKWILDARVMEYGYQMSTNDRVIRLGLNDFLYNPMERMIARRASSRTLAESPAVPKQVTAVGMYGYNIIRWIGDADAWAIRFRTENGPWQYRDTKTSEFIHNQLAVGSTWEYQVASIKNKRISSWSETVSATVSGIPPEDVGFDPTPPEPATSLQAVERTYLSIDGVLAITVELTWKKSISSNSHQQFIERAEGQGPFRPLTVVDKNAEIYLDTQALESGKTYFWRVTTISASGIYASNNPVKQLTIDGQADVLSAPAGLSVSIDNDANVNLHWQMVTAAQLKDYRIQIAGNSAFTEDVVDYYSLTNYFALTGLYSDKKVYAKVYARDRSGNESAPSNVVEINVPKLLADRVAATYLAQNVYQRLLDKFFGGTDDGYFDGSTLKPATIETQHLAVGAGTRNFQLIGVKMDANKNNTRGRFSNTAGYLVLATDVGEEAKVWNISAKDVQMTLNKEFFVYARCSKTSNSGEIMFSETRPPLQDANYHNFLIGMYFTTDDPAILSVSYGFTFINGNHITTGTIDTNMVRIMATGQAGSVVVDGLGIVFRDSSNNISIQMSTETGDAYFRGTVEAEAIILPIKPM